MKKDKLNILNVGFNNFIPLERLVAVIDANTSETNKLFERSEIINATRERKPKSIIILDNHKVVLSSVSTKTLLERIT